MKKYKYIVLNMKTRKTESFSSVVHYRKGNFISTENGEFYRIIEEV